MPRYDFDEIVYQKFFKFGTVVERGERHGVPFYRVNFGDVVGWFPEQDLQPAANAPDRLTREQAEAIDATA